MDWNHKKALVCGMARSGISAAMLLKSLGAEVTLQDKKTREELKQADALEEKGIHIFSGQNPDSIVEKQDIIVISPGIPCDLPFIEAAKKAGIQVIGEVELAFSMTPCPVAAITGTNGKTTTTALAGAMLQRVYPRCAIVGNIGEPYSEHVKGLTNKDYVAAEISSFQLETVDTFKPHISAVLNITPDHLDRHKTMENYIATKERIFQNQAADDYCVLNYDDPVCRKMAEKTKAQVLFFSSAEELESGIYLKGDHIIVQWGSFQEDIINVNELSILGTHNYENAMAAIAIALCAGVHIDEIKKVLIEFKAVEHRIEFVATVDGVDYYDDSKGTNPDAAIRAVLAMKKPILLLGGGYDKGADYSEWVKTFPGKVKKLILIGATAKKIEACALKHGFHNIIIKESFQEAIAEARESSVPGDCVLLSPGCASWDMFESYEQRGDIFKQTVQNFRNSEI